MLSWIPIEVALPNLEEEVLFFAKGCICQGRLMHDEGANTPDAWEPPYDYFSLLDDEYIDDREVTHWAALPNLPEINND